MIAWLLGVLPLFKRLGLSRWWRKIAIIANDEKYNSIKQDLLDTKIFREKNIIQISKSTLSKVKDYNLLLLHYKSFEKEDIEKVLNDKSSGTGLVVYFPELMDGEEKIPNDMLKKIDSHPFTIVTNFRGRLINDLLITFLTTSYEKGRL